MEEFNILLIIEFVFNVRIDKDRLLMISFTNGDNTINNINIGNDIVLPVGYNIVKNLKDDFKN